MTNGYIVVKLSEDELEALYGSDSEHGGIYTKFAKALIARKTCIIESIVEGKTVILPAVLYAEADGSVTIHVHDLQCTINSDDEITSKKILDVTIDENTDLEKTYIVKVVNGVLTLVEEE